MSYELTICPACGGHFEVKVGNHRRKYCCARCQVRARNYKACHGTLKGMPHKVLEYSARWRELNDQKLVRAKRLARRDAEYAAHAPKVTVEERGGVRVETRGYCPCASSLGAHRQMVADKGVAYVM